MGQDERKPLLRGDAPGTQTRHLGLDSSPTQNGVICDDKEKGSSHHHTPLLFSCVPVVWINALLALLTLVTLSFKSIALPAYIASITSAGSDPFSVALIAAFWFQCFFLLVTVGYKLCIDWSLSLLPTTNWRFLLVIGFCNGVAGIPLMFASDPDRTPPYLQALLSTIVIPYTVVFRYIILRKGAVQMTNLLLLFYFRQKTRIKGNLNWSATPSVKSLFFFEVKGETGIICCGIVRTTFVFLLPAVGVRRLLCGFAVIVGLTISTIPQLTGIEQHPAEICVSEYENIGSPNLTWNIPTIHDMFTRVNLSQNPQSAVYEYAIESTALHEPSSNSPVKFGDPDTTSDKPAGLGGSGWTGALECSRVEPPPLAYRLLWPLAFAAGFVPIAIVYVMAEMEMKKLEVGRSSFTQRFMLRC